RQCTAPPGSHPAELPSGWWARRRPWRVDTLLVLDLDETLVFAERGLRAPDFVVGPYGVRKRPHVDTFLDRVGGPFRLAVWTASSADYAHGVVRTLFGLRELAFVWTSARCTLKYDYETHDFVQLKRLGKLRRRGWDLRRVLVVDDSPEKHV